MTRILITGSRRWTDIAIVKAALARAVAEHPGPVVVVHGDARGADQLAALVASSTWPHITIERWPADWSGTCRPVCKPGHRRFRPGGGDYCPAAGAYRNAEMVAAGADLCLAFPLGKSPGTRDCMRRAEAAGIQVVNFGDQRRVATPTTETNGE